MKNIRIFLSENFHFLMVKFSVYLNRRVFVMYFKMSFVEIFTQCAKPLTLSVIHCTDSSNKWAFKCAAVYRPF